jgi:hypothetical protein
MSSPKRPHRTSSHGIRGRGRERTQPAAGQLWLSRPPFLLIARIDSVFVRAAGTFVAYDLLDDDGSPLCQLVIEPLDDAWWANFQPLVRRVG